MKELVLLITSIIANGLTRRVFFIHGSYIAWKRGELTKYWKEVAISNDMNSNVKGQHLLNQRFSKTRVFGSPLMTVSAANHLAVFEAAGEKWERRLNKLDKDHYAKSYELYKIQITKAYNELK